MKIAAMKETHSGEMRVPLIPATVDKLVKNLEKTLHDFIEGEYKLVKRHMNEHEIGSNGARVIAEHILNRVMS